MFGKLSYDPHKDLRPVAMAMVRAAVPDRQQRRALQGLCSEHRLRQDLSRAVSPSRRRPPARSRIWRPNCWAGPPASRASRFSMAVMHLSYIELLAGRADATTTALPTALPHIQSRQAACARMFFRRTQRGLSEGLRRCASKAPRTLSPRPGTASWPRRPRPISIVDRLQAEIDQRRLADGGDKAEAGRGRASTRALSARVRGVRQVHRQRDSRSGATLIREGRHSRGNRPLLGVKRKTATRRLSRAENHVACYRLIPRPPRCPSRGGARSV